MLDNDFYIWIHQQLGDHGEIARDDITSAFPGDEDRVRFGEEYLDRLHRDGVLRNEGRKYVVADESAEREKYYELLEPTVGSPEPTENTDYQPVISVPSQLQGDWQEFAEKQDIDPGISLKDALKQVFDSTEDILRLVVPYFEIDGMNLLDEEFHRLAENGVSVEILTREALVDDGTFGSNRSRKHLREAIDRYESAATAEATIDVYDYYFAIGASKPKLDRSIHAKMAIADKRVAYIGSGEVRDSSMHLNGEAGYVTRQEGDLESWVGFFEFFKHRAEPVSRSQLD